MSGIFFGWVLALANNYLSGKVQKRESMVEQWGGQVLRFFMVISALLAYTLFFKEQSFVFILSYFATHFVLLTRDFIHLHRLGYVPGI